MASPKRCHRFASSTRIDSAFSLTICPTIPTCAPTASIMIMPTSRARLSSSLSTHITSLVSLQPLLGQCLGNARCPKSKGCSSSRHTPRRFVPQASLPSEAISKSAPLIIYEVYIFGESSNLIGMYGLQDSLKGILVWVLHWITQTEV